jgi:hypothetical protein
MKIIPISIQMKIKSQKFSHIYSQMNEYIVKHIGKIERDSRISNLLNSEIVDEYDKINFSIECLYQEIWLEQFENRKIQITQLEEKKKDLFDKFVLIEKTCAELLAEQINKIQIQIDDLKNELNLSKELAYAEREIKEMYEKFAEIKKEFSNISYRKKTEMLKRIIKKIKLHFSPKVKVKSFYKTKLMRVEIFPASELLPVISYDEEFIRKLEHDINKTIYSTKNLIFNTSKI